MALAQDTYTRDELLETARFVRGHKDKEWITRSLAGRGVTGTNESVRTATYESDGKHWVVPTIRRDRKGVVRHLDREGEDPFEIAMGKEDGISFDTAEEAESFSRRYSALLGVLHPRRVETPAWEKDVDVGDMPEGWLPGDKEGKAIMEVQAKRLRELKDDGAPSRALVAQRERMRKMRGRMFEEAGGLKEPKDLPGERDVGRAGAALEEAADRPTGSWAGMADWRNWFGYSKTREEFADWLREDSAGVGALKGWVDWLTGGRDNVGAFSLYRPDPDERADRMAELDEAFAAVADYMDEVDVAKREAMRPLPEDVEGSSNRERTLRGWLEEEDRDIEKYVEKWYAETYGGTLSPLESKRNTLH